MLSKQQVSFIRLLQQKKFRQMYGKFLVEGDKIVQELLSSNYKIETIYSVIGWQPNIKNKNFNHVVVSESELKKISSHESPNQVIAIAEIPDFSSSSLLPLAPKLYLACDKINDPGNAGTIIRMADWFGIDTVFFSNDTVDIYNPKVVSAAKGSSFRVNCFYSNLNTLFEENIDFTDNDTYINGENIYNTPLSKNGFILMGNEANGINLALQPYIKHKISIPSFGKAESLNVAVATGIILSEFRRRE